MSPVMNESCHINLSISQYISLYLSISQSHMNELFHPKPSISQYISVHLSISQSHIWMSHVTQV